MAVRGLLPIIVSLRNRTERKEGGKPCVTSVTIIMSKKNFPPNLTDLFVKGQKTLMFTEDHDKTRK